MSSFLDAHLPNIVRNVSVTNSQASTSENVRAVMH
jgi:hypothetical protein